MFRKKNQHEAIILTNFLHFIFTFVYLQSKKNLKKWKHFDE